jgi:hypothetical protein
MRFATEDLVREMRLMAPGSGLDQMRDQEFRNLIMNMATVAQNVLLEGCPVFVKRLKSNPRLAEQMKKLMQTWGGEE